MALTWRERKSGIYSNLASGRAGLRHLGRKNQQDIGLEQSPDLNLHQQQFFATLCGHRIERSPFYKAQFITGIPIF